MKTKAVVLWLVIIAIYASAKECVYCNIDVVHRIYKSQDSLKQSDVNEFICGFDTSCTNYVEDSEFSNEILFLVLKKQSAMILKALNSMAPYNLSMVAKQIEHPIHDGFNLRALYDSIKNNHGRKEITVTLKNALKKAAKNLGMELTD